MREEPIRLILHRLGMQGAIRSRDWINIQCPFAPHTHLSGRDRNASFGVRINPTGSSHYYCFTCKKAGSFMELPVDLAYYGDVPFDPQAEMVEMLRIETEQGFGLFEDMPESDRPPEPLEGHIYENVYEPVIKYEAAMVYLASRGINQRAIDRMSLRYDPDDCRIVFPVYGLEGELYGFTGRTILPEEMWPAKPYGAPYMKSKDYMGLAKKHLLLNVNNFREGDKALVVEGPMDVARCESLLTDDDNVCPLGVLGSQLFDFKIETLIELNAPTALLSDNDAAGEEFLYGTDKKRGAVDKLKGELPLFVPAYPEGRNDPGELVGDELHQMLANTPMENF